MAEHPTAAEASMRTVTRLSGEDLTFWWLDSPMQPTTMAMLMILDRAPDPSRLRLALERAVAAVPRLAQRVAESPLGLSLPHWELDTTFDLDYHLREHALSGRGDMEELFHAIAPAYETPFDRSRPLWEARLYQGVNEGRQAGLFFKLHHAVADGVGANAVFAALTDGERWPGAEAFMGYPHVGKGGWPFPQPVGARLIDAVRDRVELDVERVRALWETILATIEHPTKVLRAAQALRSLSETMRFDSHSPLRHKVGRARRLSGLLLPFEEVRTIKHALKGSMIDVVLTIMARAIGRWYRGRGVTGVEELMTLVPVNLRKPEEWTEKTNVGNVATGILLPLPIHRKGVLDTYREVHTRMEAKKADPALGASPVLAELLSVFPRQLITWMSEATFGNIDFIVTNVPGIRVPRYVAGAEILAAYPFAPVAVQSPVSVALYGYRDSLFIGLTSDESSMPDVERFQTAIQRGFAELRAAACGSARAARRRAPERSQTPISPRPRRGQGRRPPRVKKPRPA